MISPAVTAAWLRFTEQFEGGIPYLYADIRGLITVAYGNLCDPLSAALYLPLKHPGGAQASAADITAAWLAVKGDPRAPAYGHRYARDLTTLRLTREGMAQLAMGKLAANHTDLVAQLPDFESYPACAQMAVHSLCWAVGTRSPYPKLFSALKARNFEVCAIEIHADEWTRGPKGERMLNAGLRPRNVANKILMHNAQRVESYKLDPELLDWTHDLGVADAETQPELPPNSTPLPMLHTPVSNTYPPPEPTAADKPTVIVHADPSEYLQNKPDPDDAA